ncbi:hypothetical protein SUGI_0808150 [Cryptomeria japonica]|uniref:E3 ubiquitin-protein ligase ATL15 n=1 Tax=Cryptomeria japonica TaxID=3369 RepID=UPI0024147D86|nr:E3 ubiquitin-protein ligase ATL15 [Cryptomeria japonica]GLJ39552.1 hypothetical protein SUGI_0808150 [Cryptomeria japonica]
MENFAALNTMNLSSIPPMKAVRLGDDNSPNDADENDEEPYNFTVRFDPSVLTTIIVLFCVFCFIAIFSIVFRRRRATWQVRRAFRRADVGNNDNWEVSQGLDRAVIESFPVFSYSRVKGLKAQAKCTACAVCLADFKEREMLRLLPKCSHTFHPECIDMWLFSHTTCPVCRTSLLPGYESNPTVPDLHRLQASPEQVTVVTDNGDRGDVSNDEATNGVSRGHSLVRVREELDQGRGTEGLTPGLHRSCNFEGINQSQEPSSSGSSVGDEDHRSRSERSVSVSLHPPLFVRSFSERIPS